MRIRIGTRSLSVVTWAHSWEITAFLFSKYHQESGGSGSACTDYLRLRFQGLEVENCSSMT